MELKQYKGNDTELMYLKEISKTLDIPLATVGHTLQRAFRNFRIIVKKNPQKYDLLFPMLVKYERSKR